MDKAKVNLFDQGLERNALGAIALNLDFLPEARRVLGSMGSDVFSDVRKTIYEKMLILGEEGKPFDVVILRGRLSKEAKSEFSVNVMGDATDIPWNLLERYLGELKALAVRRGQKDLLQGLNQAFDEDKDPEQALYEYTEGFSRLQITDREDKTKATTIYDLEKMEFKGKPYLIGKGYLPKQGYIVNLGDKKIGKTRMALQTAWCLATELPLFYSYEKESGEFPVEERGETLVLFRENNLRTLKKWLGLQRTEIESLLDRGVKNEERKAVRLIERKKTQAIYLDSVAGQREAGVFVRAHRDVSLVVFDPFERFLSKDLNKMETIVNVANFLDELSDKYGVAFLLPHHYRKLGAGEKPDADPWQRAIGSSALGNCWESGIALTRSSGRRSSLMVKAAFDFRNEKTPDEVILRQTPSLLWESISKDEAEQEGGQSLSKVLEILEEYPSGIGPGRIREIIHEKLGITKDRGSYLLSKAQADGKCWKEKGKFGDWHIGEKPESDLFKKKA